MTRSRIIRRALVTVVALSLSAPVLAEEDAKAPTEQQQPVEEVIGSLPEDQQEAVEEAIEEVESPGGTKVIVVPPPAPTVREYDPSEETDQEAEAEERVPGEKLHPKGEDEMMGDHVVDRGDIKFRPGKGVEINSSDDDFQLRIRVRVQFLWTVLSGEVGPAEADEPNDVANNFRIRRARFVFQGHAFGKHNQYKLEIDPLRNDNVVLDYYLDFTKKRDIQVRVGQYKISSNRQRVISSGNLQMVDRSIVNAEFSLDRDIGIDIRSRDFLGKNKMRYVLGISAGNGLNNHTQFSDFSMVYLARFEYLPLGIFRDMSEVDFARTKPRLAIAATYSFFQGANRVRGMTGADFADGGTANYHFAYADVLLKARGFSALTELSFREGFRKNIGDNTEPPGCDPVTDPMCTPATATAPRNGIGWMLQAGYLVPNTRFEFAARGALVKAISSRRPTSLTDRYGTTFSVSWYFARHPFKIQADVSQIWNPDQEVYKDGATTFRLQLQASL